MTLSTTSNTNEAHRRTYQIPYRTTGDDEDKDPWNLEALLERIQKLLDSNNSSGNDACHKVCLAIAGGGGTSLSGIAATSGASSILLEGTVTYDRSSYQTYVRKNSSSLSQGSASSKKFSYTSMHAAKLASQSALWRGMELQNLNTDGNDDNQNNQALLHTIGVGAASTLQTNTIGAKSRTGRPSFGNIVATRGDGLQISLRFTLNHFSRNEIKNPRFQQDLMVSHLILQGLEHFIVEENKINESSAALQQYEVTDADIDPTDFPGVTVQQWTTNVMTDGMGANDEEAKESLPASNDPVEAAANRILSGHEQAVLLLPKKDDISATTTPNSFLQPVVYPVLPENALIFPGSFNPPHHGHLALAGAAAKAVQKVSENTSTQSNAPPMVVFELSIVNADKPPMESEEVASRVALFRELLYNSDQLSSWGILLTSAPLFADKVQTLRQAAPSGLSDTAFSHMQQQESTSSKWSFVIGTDTMVRILNPKYYDNNKEQMMQSLRKMNVKFVVGGRLDQSDDAKTTFVTGEAELEGLPEDIQDMFLLLQESDFRVDVSSTELRAKAAAAVSSDDDDDSDDTHQSSNISPGRRKGKTALGMNWASKLLNVILALGVSVLALGLPTCEAFPTNQHLSARPRERIQQSKLFDSFAFGNPASVPSFMNTLDPSHRFLKDEKKKEEETEDKKAEESTSTTEELCTSVAKCEQCTFSDQKNYEACKETGRWEKFECTMGGQDTAEVRTEMRSCKYTEADEEFAMIRLQMMCLLIGSIAIASVRKQKRVSANLFDQRKQGIAPGAAQNGAPNKKMSCVITPNDDEEIEFTPMTNQEREMVPLTQINEDDLEVV